MRDDQCGTVPGWRTCAQVGPLHGDSHNGGPGEFLITPDLNIVAARACCIVNTFYDNSVRYIELYTSAGRTLVMGDNTTGCEAMQAWWSVPSGYRFAGFVTSTNPAKYVQRLQFVAAAASAVPSSPPPPSPPPPSPPPTSSPSMFSCVDQVATCQAWSQQGYCDSQYTYNGQSVHDVVCAKSCNIIACGTYLFCTSSVAYGSCAAQMHGRAFKKRLALGCLAVTSLLPVNACVHPLPCVCSSAKPDRVLRRRLASGSAEPAVGQHLAAGHDCGAL